MCVSSHNQLTSLPVEVFALMNLRSLTLQQNLVDRLPEELGRLEKLTELVTAKFTFLSFCLVVVVS